MAYSGAVPALRLLACAAALGVAGLGVAGLGACAPRLDVPPAPEVSARLTYIGRVAWGEVAAYEAEYAAQDHAPYAGLDWSRNGCSAPDGLGLGYRELFRPACNVHDFAYRNLKVYERTDANRKTSDEAFHTNMKAICAAKSWIKRPPCVTAAYAYYQAVRVGGGSSFE